MGKTRQTGKVENSEKVKKTQTPKKTKKAKNLEKAKGAEKQPITWPSAIGHIALLLILAALFQIFFLLSLHYFKGSWNSGLYLTALIGGTALNLLLALADLLLFFFRKELWYKLCITTYVCADFAVIVLYVLLRTGFFDIMSDEEGLAAYLERSGKWMAILFVVLQFLQVVILPIPSTVTVVAGAALFGPLMGSLYSLLGIVLGSLTGFLIGRYAGYRVVAWLVGKDTLDKWLKKIKGKDKLLLSAMFILPVFPDDVLCFVAGISSMSLALFLGIIIISRVAAIFMTSYSVTLIPFNPWWGLMTWAILISLVVLLFIFLYKKSDQILDWMAKKFHRETRIEEKSGRDEFTLEIVTPNGDLYEKGVKRGEENKKEDPSDQA